jgi:hypothetical protein
MLAHRQKTMTYAHIDNGHHFAPGEGDTENESCSTSAAGSALPLTGTCVSHIERTWDHRPLDRCIIDKKAHKFAFAWHMVRQHLLVRAKDYFACDHQSVDCERRMKKRRRCGLRVPGFNNPARSPRFLRIRNLRGGLQLVRNRVAVPNAAGWHHRGADTSRRTHALIGETN